MRFSWQGLVLLIILIIIVDGSLLFFKDKQKGKSYKLLDILLYILIPITFIVSFVSFYFAVPLTDSAQIYYRFGWFMIVFLILYLPKLIWGVWSFVLVGLEWIDGKDDEVDIVNQQPKIEKIPYPKISRKKFLSQIGIILATAPAISLLFGALKGRFKFYTRYQKLSFPNLPSSFDGLRIVQISDLHLGSFNSNYETMQEVVDMINDEHPDVIVFTGDLVNNFYQETIGWEKIFSQLKAKVGKYSILGNHDYGYYTKWNSRADNVNNFSKIVESHKRLGFELLRNENVILSAGGESIAIAGVEYWGTSRKYPNTGDVEMSLSGLENIPFKVLLTHDPDHWDAEIVGKTDYDLSLSGHTHGMQFGIDYKGFRWSPAKYKFNRWDGLYKKNNQFLFVNRGLGVLGMPARVGMSPEITVIDLSRGPLGTEPM
ncbi:MAG: metallophosphoesterase [Marinilabiliaceae bacterium]|nr:metallophosphoesterase [Marinilabiliaceae bacterium]